MQTQHEVVYGGLGCGKSTYAFKIITPEETLKLGVGNYLREILIMKFGSIKRHEAESRKMGIETIATNIKTVVNDIVKVEKPILLLDEWTTFFSYSYWLSENEIIHKANAILDAVENNPNIQRGVYVVLDYNPYLFFNLYKKKALWNKILFKRADKITKVDYGKPIDMYSKQDEELYVG